MGNKTPSVKNIATYDNNRTMNRCLSNSIISLTDIEVVAESAVVVVVGLGVLVEEVP